MTVSERRPSPSPDGREPITFAEFWAIVDGGMLGCPGRQAFQRALCAQQHVSSTPNAEPFVWRSPEIRSERELAQFLKPVAASGHRHLAHRMWKRFGGAQRWLQELHDNGEPHEDR